MSRADSKPPRETDGGRLDDDAFLRVLEALGYSEDLATCTFLDKRTSPLATNLMSRARKEAVEASGGFLRHIDERVYNRFFLFFGEGGRVEGPQRVRWAVEEKDGDAGTRVAHMRNCETFVRHNFPMRSVVHLLDHLPLFRGDVRGSLRLARCFTDVPDDLRSPSFELIKIHARMITRDPALHICVSGVVHANLGDGIGMSDATSSVGRFLGRLHLHARHVHWTACRAHVVE